MGLFCYGADAEYFEDIDLAHLQAVIVNKLRRAEPFMLSISGGMVEGTKSFWIHDHAAMLFRFTGQEEPHYDRGRLESMIQDAGSAQGLQVVGAT